MVQFSVVRYIVNKTVQDKESVKVIKVGLYLSQFWTKVNMKVAIFLPKVLFWLEITKLEFKQKSIIGFKKFFLISIPLINEEIFPLEFGMKSNFGI